MKLTAQKKITCMLGLMALTLPAAWMAGCDNSVDSAEDVGESIDNAADDAGDSINDAADNVDDTVDDAIDG